MHAISIYNYLLLNDLIIQYVKIRQFCKLSASCKIEIEMKLDFLIKSQGSAINLIHVKQI